MASMTPSFAAKVPALFRRRLHVTLISPVAAANRLPFPRTITFQSIQTKSSLSPPPPTTGSLEHRLPSNLQQIVTLFQSSPDPKSKYQQLLFYGQNLVPLDSRYKTPKNKVQGCVSQVWVRAYLDGNGNGNVVFEADSDSVLTKGLAALLVKGLSGCSVEEVLRVSPEFVKLLGLQQSLTPSRNNGFLNMLMLMQKKAAELLLGAEGGERVESDVSLDVASDSSNKRLDLEANNGSLKDSNGSGMDYLRESSSFEASDRIAGSNNGDGELQGRAKRIKEVLMKELRPVELKIEDVSYQHAGHAGVRGSGDGETHFDLRVVSDGFEGKSLVKRHRLIYHLLQEELNSGLHALSIVAKTPDELVQR